MSWLLILYFVPLSISFSTVYPPPYQVNMLSGCPQDQTHRFLDISNANIETSKHLQFNIQLYDAPIENIFRSQEGVTLQGNFTKLVVRNIRTKKQTTYLGGEMIVRSPPNHVFNLQKIPQIQIQIKLKAVDAEENNPIKFAMLSQLYVISKFPKSIQTNLSKHFSWQMRQLKTSEVIKILEGFPMLMYRGALENYPCRTDLLVLLKREYQLIREEDLQYMKEMIIPEARKFKAKKAFKRKSLYEVYPMKKKASKINNDEL